MSDLSLIASALALARRGWRVFPLQPGGKTPMIREMTRAKKTEVIGVRATKELRSCLEQDAVREDLSVSIIARRILTDHYRAQGVLPAPIQEARG